MPTEVAGGLVARGGPAEAARQRLLSLPREPMFYSDWVRPLFLHYEVDPGLLQPAVPFPLDLRDGRACVSLVAFTMRDLRPRWGGRVGAWLFRPIATHELLNVRAYVKHQGEPGIFFLREFIPNRLSAWLGPRTFGLPYHHGRLQYEHHQETGQLQGSVEDGKGRLVYSAEMDPNTAFHPCAPGSLTEFTMERYTAFTRFGSQRKFFRIWHPPWRQAGIEAKVHDATLLTAHFPWAADARLVGANYSPGADRVWMGWPHRLQCAATL